MRVVEHLVVQTGPFLNLTSAHFLEDQLCSVVIDVLFHGTRMLLQTVLLFHGSQHPLRSIGAKGFRLHQSAFAWQAALAHYKTQRFGVDMRKH